MLSSGGKGATEEQQKNSQLMIVDVKPSFSCSLPHLLHLRTLPFPRKESKGSKEWLLDFLKKTMYQVSWCGVFS